MGEGEASLPLARLPVLEWFTPHIVAEIHDGRAFDAPLFKKESVIHGACIIVFEAEFVIRFPGLDQLARLLRLEEIMPVGIGIIGFSGPVADTYDGVEDFVQRGLLPSSGRLAAPLTPEVHHIWAVGDRVITRFDASATTSSGTPYNNRFVWIFQMEDGSVIEAEAFLNLVAYEEVVDNNEPRAQ